MINATQNNSSAALFSALNASSSSVASTAAKNAADTQDRFLKLLVTQMKNQDPLNPMDNAQVTSQMAQLSTVSGIDKLNTTLQALSNSMTANQSLQAATMIGHGILSPGSSLEMTNGVALGGVQLPQSVDSLQITILDQAGNTVRTQPLGALPAGVHSWQWDGKNDAGVAMASGTYSFTASAAQAGNNVTTTPLTFGVVNGVTQGSQGASLNVGLNGMVAMSQVLQIL